MPKITFGKTYPPIEFLDGANLMKTLTDAGVPVASSCQGEGVCAKCKVRILEGAENLSRENATESDLREIHDLAKDERISCQSTAHGDVKVDTRYW